jgi:hypothetical protein
MLKPSGMLVNIYISWAIVGTISRSVVRSRLLERAVGESQASGLHESSAASSRR